MSDDLTMVPGIGAAMAVVLAENGIKSVRALAKTPVSELVLVKGFSDLKAAAVIAAAQDMVGARPSRAAAAKAAVANAEKTAIGPSEQTGGKKKAGKKEGGKKGKGKKKGKRKGKKGKKK